MTLRFLAIGGEAAARAAFVRRAGLGTAAGLVRRAAGTSLELWTPGQVTVLDGREGASWLVGFAYDRATGRSLREMPSGPASSEAMLRDGWGSYVLLVERPNGHWVLRDPSGAVTVYRRRENGCDIYASDEALLFLGATRAPSPDLAFIRHWLSFPYLRGARTGCRGVREILPGQRRTVEGGCSRERQAWSPGACAARGGIRDLDEAAALLREELLRCIPRAVPDTGRAVLKLSGGLDSSLIAMALAAAGRTFTAVNFATQGPEGDERSYARIVAAACGAELVELEEQPCAIDLGCAPLARLRPPRHPMRQCLDRAYALQWTALGAGAVIDGAGGDNLFAYLNTAAPVLDAWACRGAPGVVRAIGDLTGVHGGTLWTTAGFAWRKARRGTTTRWPANPDFLMPDAVTREPEPHPWLEVAESALPGSREHIRSIVGVHVFLADPSGGSPATMHPLLAQPILELCLRIPTHLWILGGRDRAVARAAFADLLPEAVNRRRHKGALGGMFRAQFRTIVPELSDFLRKGRLAEAGIVDGAAIADYLAGPNLWQSYTTTRLLEIAAAEQWLRSFV